MGLLHGKMWDQFATGTREMRILMLGLDGAGKSTVLYRLKLGDVVCTIPTFGLNVESLEYKNLKFQVVGGGEKERKVWTSCCSWAHGLIYVIDSSDRDRIEVAREELVRVLDRDEMHGAPLLVFANKQDLEGAMTTDEVLEKLALQELSISRSLVYMAQGSCSPHGLHEGLRWLTRVLAARQCGRLAGPQPVRREGSCAAEPKT